MYATNRALMNIGNFAGDYGGVGLVGSLIMLTIPLTDISATVTIIIGALTVIGQGVAWYVRYLDRKERRRRFDGIARLIEGAISDRIKSDSLTPQDTDTFLRLMEKLDDIDKS